MKFRFEKNMRIMADLAGFCNKHGARDYHMDLETPEGQTLITVRSAVPHVPAQALEQLKYALSLPRQQEVEQNYWGLSGDGETDSELTLVGMMVDEARVDYSDGVLTIYVKRLEE